MNKRKIVLDVDDVLGEFTRSLNKFYNERYGTNFRFEDYSVYDLTKIWGRDSKEVRRIIFDFYSHPSLTEIKPLEFSQNVLQMLNASGENEFIACSYRIGWIECETKNWIRENFFDMKTRCIGYKSKSKLDLCKEEDANFIVEDNLQTVIECTKAGITAILISRPWNQRVPNDGFCRAKNWRNVLDYLK